MLELIMKDFMVQKKTIVRYVISGFVIGIMFVTLTDMKQIAMSMGMVMFPIIYGFMNGALYEDEKNNTLRLLASLPIERKVIVQARYISVISVTAILAVALWLISLFLPKELLGRMQGTDVSGGLILLALTLAFILMVSVYLPLVFKLGYIKAAGINRFVMIALFGAIGGAGALVGKMTKNTESPQWILTVGNFLEKIHPTIILGSITLVVVFIYYMSMKLSISFFKKRNIF